MSSHSQFLLLNLFNTTITTFSLATLAPLPYSKLSLMMLDEAKMGFYVKIHIFPAFEGSTPTKNQVNATHNWILTRGNKVQKRDRMRLKRQMGQIKCLTNNMRIPKSTGQINRTQFLVLLITCIVLPLGLSMDGRHQLLSSFFVKCGFGGGSSNAATALWVANQISGDFATERTSTMVMRDRLGVPFFFCHGVAYCTGRGDVCLQEHNMNFM